jgi:hypothetical protein
MLFAQGAINLMGLISLLRIKLFCATVKYHLMGFESFLGGPAQLEVACFQRRDAWTEMVILYRFADVELIDL